ncbi:MAG: saccharopine dehydrogenase NADP-binding domain-containing protein [Acidobacteriota bacterium]
MAKKREFDLVLWGASGFTGALVAEVLQRRCHEEGVRWALGGRNEKKLSAVRERIGAPDLPLILGDGEDAESLAAMAGSTRVVCTTVGPYAKYGSKLVEACVEAGTDYCDLTGEVHWIRQMIDAHETTARETGARIVPTCGFDSIPSDIGVFAVQGEMRRRYDVLSPFVRCGVADFKGGLSGGTLASMLNMMETAGKDRSVRRLMADPYALDPEGTPEGKDSRDQAGPRYDGALGEWTAPFVMAAINTRVVRRSKVLLEYGDDFRYEESMLMGSGPFGAARAASVSAGMGAGVGALAVPPLRWMAMFWLPEPGEGPTPEQQRNGFWELRFHADGPEDVPSLDAKLTGDRDPGYGSTSKMLAESALSLAVDSPIVEGGFWTPASGLGQQLLDRLTGHAGLAFEVLD